MRTFWDQQHDSDTAFASQAETVRAIQSVLRIRHDYLRSKNITNLRHVLTEPQRAELVKEVRREYEQSEEQLSLQKRDVEKAKGKGKTPLQPKGSVAKYMNAQRTGKEGVANYVNSQRTGKGGKGQETGKGSVATYVNAQKQKRWCRHLQCVCGTKQIWEGLAFSGRFDADMLRQA